MAYLYRHIRLDKNEPFYIGIGLKDDNYKRAYSTNRTKFWKIIASKGGYEVEILLDGLSDSEVKEKEKEFIELYGKKSNGGTLCNLTDGGDGTKGYQHTEEAKRKLSKPKSDEHKKLLSELKLGSKASEETREKMRIAQMGRKQPQSCIDKLKSRVFSKETREKMGAWQRGMKKSEESTKKRIEKLKGRPSWNKGIAWSEETKLKMKGPKTEVHKQAMRKPKKRLICDVCGFEGGGGNMIRYHFKNCKYG